MVEPVGSLPFAVDLQRARESIEAHQKVQNVQKVHLRAHKLERVLERQNYELMVSYDRFGAKNTGLKPQGQVVDLEV
jgi:hypothetical protein